VRRLIVNEFLSVDGVMQGPGSPDEDRDGGFQHGGWQTEYFDEGVLAGAREGMGNADAYLFGRRTYQIMAAHWPTAPDDDPFAGHLNATKKYVASRTLTELDWQNSELLQGDASEAVARLKEQPGNDIVVLGSGELVQTLMAHGLVDEFGLIVSPLLLGSGKRLFRDAEQVRRLKLVRCTSTPKGNLLVSYQPAA
jgi:dihydrofolate reductase